MKKYFSTAEKGWNNFWEYLSESDLIVFDRRVRRLLVISAALFSILVFLRISYSSIGKWKEAAPGKNEKEESVLLGTPRGIRSDEWCVVTPFILAQANHIPNFPVENENLGAGKVPLLMSLPARHFSMFFRPQNWGFFLFDLERGYSFYWNTKVFGLFLSFFLLLMLLTRSNFWLSFAGSLWLFFSSFVQWWFSAPPMPPEMIASAAAIFIALAYLFFSTKRWLVPFSALVLLMASVNFVLFFYPPFQIPLAYLVAFLFAGYLIQNSEKDALRKNLRLKAIFLMLFVAFFSLAMFKFYQDTRETIQIVRNTAYPGVRTMEGGEMSVARFFSGFFGIFMAEKKYPGFYSVLENICEASSFILFFPLLLALLARDWLKKRSISFLQLSLALYTAFISLWMLVGFPKIIAKITLLNLVSANRSLIGLGTASIILTIVFLSERKIKDEAEEKPNFRFANFFVFGLIFFLMVWYGFALRKATDNFFAVWQVWLTSFWIATMTLLLVRRKRIWFFALLLPPLLVVNGLVNPVVSGLDAIRGNRIFKFAEEKKKENPDARWIFFGNLPLDNLLQSAGVNIANGTKYAPDLPAMEKLDPERKYISVYNRYAYVKFKPVADKKSVVFTLEKTDKYAIEANPCSEKIKGMNADFVVIQGDPEKYNLDCLEQIEEKSLNRARIFKYKEE